MCHYLSPSRASCFCLLRFHGHRSKDESKRSCSGIRLILCKPLDQVLSVADDCFWICWLVLQQTISTAGPLRETLTQLVHIQASEAGRK
ncbi:hypothetical protein MHYP_G00351120 [Metynnis hypsauchen]